MKKLIFIICLFITSISYGQVVGLNGNVVYNRGIGVNDGTGDSVLRQQSDRRWTMIHRYDLYGANARGNFIYGNLAGSSQTGATEAMIAIGHNALRLNTIGYNIGIGWQSLYNLDASSSGNIAIGAYRPMFNQTGGNNNILIGYNIDQAVLSGSNQLNIGSAIWGVGTNDVTGQNVSAGKIGIFKTTPTEALDLVGNFRFSGALKPNNAAGTAGQVLTSAGAGGPPTWEDPSGGSGDPFFINPVIGPTNFFQLARERNDSTLDIKSLQISRNGTAITPTVTDTTIHFEIDSATRAGTYIPTITGTANLAASTSGVFHWTKSGDWYEVSGEISLDPTTTATLTVVRLSLPISSSIPTTYNITGFASDDLGTVGRIRGDTGNNEAQIRFTPVDVTNRVFTVRFRFPYIAP